MILEDLNATRLQRFHHGVKHRSNRIKRGAVAVRLVVHWGVRDGGSLSVAGLG